MLIKIWACLSQLAAQFYSIFHLDIIGNLVLVVFVSPSLEVFINAIDMLLLASVYTYFEGLI